MPVEALKVLPPKARSLWESVFEESKNDTCDDSCAASKAWAAVKRGYKKGKDGKWYKKMDELEAKSALEQKGNLENFSLVFKKLSEVNGERRWQADTSDVDDDLAGDNMTLELYSDFLDRIEKSEKPDDAFCSEFWAGGLPYLSISHYSDLNGDGVPGPVDAVYVDGKFLKAKGRFSNTPLGDACWNSLQKDKLGETNDKVRISIAFLDYMHRHKSSGVEFNRLENPNGYCLECLKEMVSGEYGGKEFLKGHLIHLALTRVPMNTRTIIQEDKSMAKTKLEDAESIVGEELAEVLDEKSKEVLEGKSLVVKSEEQSDELAVLKAELAELKSMVEALAKMKDKKEPMKEEDEEEDEEGDEEEGKNKKDKKEKKADHAQDVEVFVEAISRSGMLEKLDLLVSAVTQERVAQNQAPQRRSFDPATAMLLAKKSNGSDADPKKPISFKELARRSVGLDE